MRSTTLRSQLTRTFMLPALIALALNACLIVAYEFQRYRTEAVDELHTQEIILAKALVPSLVFNDPDAAAQQLSSLRERRDIRIAEVFSANGRPFARYQADAQGADDLPTQNPLPSLGSRFSGDDLELAYDVYHDGERVGTLYLRAHHDVLRRIGSYGAIQARIARPGAAGFSSSSRSDHRADCPRGAGGAEGDGGARLAPSCARRRDARDCGAGGGVQRHVGGNGGQRCRARP